MTLDIAQRAAATACAVITALFKSAGSTIMIRNDFYPA